MPILPNFERTSFMTQTVSLFLFKFLLKKAFVKTDTICFWLPVPTAACSYGCKVLSTICTYVRMCVCKNFYTHMLQRTYIHTYMHIARHKIYISDRYITNIQYQSIVIKSINCKIIFYFLSRTKCRKINWHCFVASFSFQNIYIHMYM